MVLLSRKLRNGQVAFANYRIGKELFGNIDAFACDTEFEFGRDGKPYFVSSPYDTPERSKWIVGMLAERCGRENFHFTLGMSASEFDSVAIDADDIDAEEWEEVKEGGYLE